ncbi:hypothetical protein EON65_42335 [archaeon]|nr:MAG: hypothetical protein EON65_42335 [archaeon]
MSESEGLAKLAEYLKQTRRQAEAAIDHLNEQIVVLNQAIEERDQQLHVAHGEIRDLKLSIMKMQEDKSMKSVFKERDDWKSLVDSIQKDRGRLQQENTTLQQSLDTATSEIGILKQQLQEMERERESLTLTQLPEPGGGDDHSRLAADNNIPMSPIIDRSGNTILIADSTPHSLAQKLKEELKRVHRQVSL